MNFKSINGKKMIGFLLKVFGIVLTIYLSVYTVDRYINSIRSPKVIEREEIATTSISDLHNMTKEKVIAILGEPREIYKDSLYRYKDNTSEYDILIKDKVKSIHIYVKKYDKYQSIDEVESLLKLKSGTLCNVKGTNKYACKNVGNYRSVEVDKDPNTKMFKEIRVEFK